MGKKRKQKTFNFFKNTQNTEALLVKKCNTFMRKIFISIYKKIFFVQAVSLAKKEIKKINK